MASTKTKRPAAKKPAAQKPAPKKSDVDRRWSILLFGIGILFVLVSFIPGDAGWAFARKNILFGAFGISGWLFGPMVIWWAVLVSLGKPSFGAIIKGCVFMLVMCGTALVFGSGDIHGLPFGEMITYLHAQGAGQLFGGGVLSMVFGAPFLLLLGKLGARIVFVLLVVVATMLLTGVTPGDVVRFFSKAGNKIGDRLAGEDEYYDDEEDEYIPEPPPPIEARRQTASVSTAVPPAQKTNTKMAVVDIPLEGKPSRTPKTARVDIPINDTKPIDNDSEFGLGDYEPLVPFASLGSGTQKQNTRQNMQETPDILLFGEHDPYANLGGANTRLPKGNLFDVEYIPKPDNNFDLFGGGQKTDAEVTATPKLPNMRHEEVRQVQADENTNGDTEIINTEGIKGQEANLEKLLDKASRAGNKNGQSTGQKVKADEYDGVYSYPPVKLFDAATAENNAGAREEMRKTAELLVNTLASFGVQTSILDVSRGPSVTRYEVQPQAGVKISRITGLADDIALNLAAAGVRIEAPIPGKPAVGIEVPNKVKSTVPISGILQSAAFTEATSPLSMALGKDIAGDVVVTDLTKMPHLLIAGSTGSGKSVCVNSIIMSFLYKSSPEHVRLILIDPKVVELAEYNGIPHLLIPVVTQGKQAAKALGYATKMMEDRYNLFAQYGVRDITSYNKFAKRSQKVETIPHIAIIIDELADLMMVAGKDVENYICRIAQKARAAGMHLIVATQRPSVDVITGLIKANIPSRIAFAVSSQVDSRTILDGAGAEKLLGMGDMLFMPIGANKPVRVQGTFVKDREISRVLNYIKSNSGAKYDEDVLSEIDKISLSGAAAQEDATDEGVDLLADPTFINAVEMALDAGEVSTSALQRRLRLGYARAGRIVDQMERMGIVSEPNGSKPRQVLISRQHWQEMVMNAHE